MDLIQDSIQEVLEKNKVGFWSLDLISKKIKWPFNILSESLFKPKIHTENLQDLFCLIYTDDQVRVNQIILDCIQNKKNLDIEFRLESNSKNWYRIKASMEFAINESPVKISGIIWNETDQSNKYNQIDLHRNRLKSGILELHHRTKNSFQIIRSLLNMEVRKNGSLDQEAVKKIIAYLQGLVLIQDFITDNLKNNQASEDISAKDLFQRLSQVLQNLDPHREIEFHIKDFSINIRMASTLVMIITELIFIAKKYGNGRIDMNFVNNDNNNISLKIGTCLNNDSCEEIIAKNSGIELVRFLIKGDFKTKLNLVFDKPGYLSAEFEFPTVANF